MPECLLCTHTASEHQLGGCRARQYYGGHVGDYIDCDCPGYEAERCRVCGGNGCPDCEEDT
ncbi:hypothetical protein [Mycobacterium heckeshornense]|uniref:hypothetical protein n=1 Tax=Mycobacterium heckeshornense TaxID=110505 RepID=UPI0006627B61|nr:hypothetical protein [Mycobacterium heckeshornense]KMV23354.1 hypothetical protein ACT16_06720 [Mycobacterium heckeshornense]